MNVYTHMTDKMLWLVAQLIGWPLIIYVMVISMFVTVALRFVQLRYFFYALKELIAPTAKTASTGEMTPFQAFVNTLSSNLGNGSIAGMATAIHMGGPGAAFWVVAFGFILMAVRFAEVYLSTYFASHARVKTVLGGPLLYLKEVIGGSVLVYIYALSCFIFGLAGGNALQANSISLSLNTTWHIPTYVAAWALLALICYILFGGAARIVRFSDIIVPIKVIVFFASAFGVLGYHYQALIPAVMLIIKSAFSPIALGSGMIGFSVQHAMRFGLTQAVFATESGLGTAAILFGATGSSQPMKDGLMGMMSTFVSACVCFIVTLCIVASGQWVTDLDSTALTIASYNTVFGQYGGWIVSFLSVTFGMGVMVSYAYITRAAWLFLTSGRFSLGFVITYSAATFIGAIAGVRSVWMVIDIVNVAMLVINLFAIVYLLPVIRRGVKEFKATR
jgi:alanine or glycine:cation symporter, AGCS family